MARGSNLATFELTEVDGSTRIFGLAGRFRQTLEALIEAGSAGVTSYEVSSWALRFSHYTWVFRHKHGLLIETVREPHTIGEISGHHARYILRDRVRELGPDDIAGRVAKRLADREGVAA